MSIVTFWNNDREQSGKTLTSVAVAVQMAIERNYKILSVDGSILGWRETPFYVIFYKRLF